MDTARLSASQRASVEYPNLVDQLRMEFERVVKENKQFSEVRDTMQHKLESHITELTALERKLADLEGKHQALKEQCEAEISRLKGHPQQRIPPVPQQPPPPMQLPSQQMSAQQQPRIHQMPPLQAHPKQEVQMMPRSVGPSLQSLPPPRAQMIPEASSQIPPYPAALQTPFSAARSIQSHPHQIAQPPHPHASMPMQPKFPQRLAGPPAHPQPQSLHPAQPLPSPSAIGHSATNVPSMMTNPIQNDPRATMAMGPSPKLRSAAIMSASREADLMQHSVSVKKDHDMMQNAHAAQPPPIFGPTPNGQSAISPSANRHPTLANANQPVQQDVDADWRVLRGRGVNGSMVSINVSLQTTLPHDSVVCCVRYSWDGQYLATGSNRTAHIFDATNGTSVATFSKDPVADRDENYSNPDSYVRAVCFSPDGNWLITGAEDHVVKVWDIRNRKVKHRLVGHDTDIYSVDASANSQFIISGSGDKTAKLWGLESGKLLSTLGTEHGPTDGITSVSVSPTSQHVAAGSLDKIVRVWDVESGRLVRQFEGHSDSVYSVAFSPDGRMLLSGSLDRSLKLWDLAANPPSSSQCRLSFTGHNDFVLSVAFSPNGRWLISGSKDRTVQFWDPRQSTAGLVLQVHKNSVISIAHNPATSALATGSGDCRARMWRYT